MNVTDENARLWISERKRTDGSAWQDYSVSISKKTESGDYVNTYIKVRFAKSVEVPEGLQNGVKMDYEGFVTVDTYTDKDGKEIKRPMVMITSASFDIPKAIIHVPVEEIAGFQAAEDDIPF